MDVLLTLQANTSAISYSDITTDLTSYTWDTVAETLNKRIYCPIVNTGYIAQYTRQSDILYTLGATAITFTIPAYTLIYSPFCYDAVALSTTPTITYTATLSDGTVLPSSIITFSASTR